MLTLKHKFNLLVIHFSGLIVTWMVVVLSLMGWNLAQVQRTQHEMARNEARATLNKDQTFRFWAASHGGVYVPVAARTPVNPFLSHVPERDIVTPSGKLLTLMNPAYVLRQMMDQYTELYGIRGHITSLKPLRTETAPDGWEREALLKFEQGDKEVSEHTEIDGSPHLRLMRPIYVKEECLGCHTNQGYRAGDVRGGISVAVPTAPYLASARKEMIWTAVSFGVLLLLGLVGIGFARHAVMSQMRSKDEAESNLRDALDSLEAQARELEQSNQLLKQSNEALGDFTTIASHDLQEPLRKIRAFGDLLYKKCAGCLDEERIDYIERIQKSVNRMQALMDALLVYSRVTTQANSFAPIDLDGLIGEVLDDLEVRLLQTGGCVEVGELPGIHGDADQMRQLFQNLIGNALKYHSPGVKPLVKVYCLPEAGRVAEIHIEDNGIGFEERDLKRIFAPFERLHSRSQYDGMGMGLAICKKIVERHGGAITARSTPGVGSTFILKLPVGGLEGEARGKLT
jgi:signal transduction histidine kinase